MNVIHNSARAGLFLGAALALVGCPSNQPPPVVDGGVDAPPPIDAFVAPPDTPPVPDAPVDAGPLPDVGELPDAPEPTCPAESARDTVTVSGSVNEDQHWTCEHNYLLSGGPVYLVGNHVITVDPGVVVRGQVRNGARVCTGTTTPCTGDGDCASGVLCGPPAELGTALIITRGSRLVANGTATRPIVFTSERTGTSTDPAPGNWGGLVLLGSAPTNNVPPDGAFIEGLPPAGEGLYGGSMADSSCGELSYVRVEYAGFIFSRANELNGITMGGCGAGTIIHHVQVHRGLDDGIEVFGGTVNLHHIVVTGTGDDSLDWDLGWTGAVQFYLAQQRNAPGEERCIEGDNHPTVFGSTPRSSPTLYNFTCIGAGNAPGVDATLRAALSHDGAILRAGSAGTIRNSIFFGSPDQGIQIDDRETGTPPVPPADSDTVGNLVSGAITVENNILFNIGDTGTESVFRSDPYRMGGAEVTARSALEAMLLADNRNVDPAFGGNPNDLTAPDFTPSAAVAGTMTATEPTTPAGFWEDVDYAGAVDPDAAAGSEWYAGWTRWTP